MSSYSDHDNSLSFKRREEGGSYSHHDNSLAFKRHSERRIKRASGGAVSSAMAPYLGLGGNVQNGLANASSIPNDDRTGSNMPV